MFFLSILLFPMGFYLPTFLSVNMLYQNSYCKLHEVGETTCVSMWQDIGKTYLWILSGPEQAFWVHLPCVVRKAEYFNIYCYNLLGDGYFSHEWLKKINCVSFWWWCRCFLGRSGCLITGDPAALGIIPDCCRDALCGCVVCTTALCLTALCCWETTCHARALKGRTGTGLSALTLAAPQFNVLRLWRTSAVS